MLRTGLATGLSAVGVGLWPNARLDKAAVETAAKANAAKAATRRGRGERMAANVAPVFRQNRGKIDAFYTSYTSRDDRGDRPGAAGLGKSARPALPGQEGVATSLCRRRRPALPVSATVRRGHRRHRSGRPRPTPNRHANVAVARQRF